MPKESKKPRIGAHVPTTGGMAKRSIEYAQEIGASAIQVFASSPRMWAMPAAKPHQVQALPQALPTYVDLMQKLELHLRQSLGHIQWSASPFRQ